LKIFFKRSVLVDVERAKMVQALRAAGHRLTQPRMAVLQVLQKSDEGLTPEEIAQQGREICTSLGLVTVYRTLDLLAELGLVRRVHSEHHCQRYARAGIDRHYLVCDACHRVVEFPCAGLEELIERVGRQTGYTIQSHLLELSGLCPQCQKAGSRE
jgi:Fur family ferric uptake transcriptional regulator